MPRREVELSRGPTLDIASDLASFAELARARRTSLQVDIDRPVPVELVEELCALAASAPNHKRTWPWRFALFTGDGRFALGQEFAAALEARGADDAKLAKTRTKYGRAPADLLIGAVSPEPARVVEDGYAVAAAVQNILLGATAAGLASYWSSPPVSDAPGVLALAGFPPGTILVALIYLGWPSRAVDAPPRPAIELHHVTGPGNGR
jgi:nitroreductase